jgi:SAM-dependent methyltransferase
MKSWYNVMELSSSCWKEFTQSYGSRVFSVTSFGPKRRMIVRSVIPGVVVDLGCGPLGFLLRDIAQLRMTYAVGSDFCWEMIVESRQRTLGCDVQYVLADNRCLGLMTGSVDTVVAVNSLIPEARAEVDLAFEEVGRVLRKGGRLVAVLPSFEMSIAARDQWGIRQRLDLQRHREWDTSGWQCFYSWLDIESLMNKYAFRRYRVERMIFSATDEIEHIREVYAEHLKSVPRERLVQYPLFEHFLIAER